MHPDELSDQQWLDQVLANVAGDAQLDDAVRVGICSRLEASADPIGEWPQIQAAHVGNLQNLTPIPWGDAFPSGAGHLQFRASFARSVADRAGVGEDTVNELIDGLAGNSTRYTVSEARTRWDITVSGLAVRAYSPVWLFAEQGHDPFGLASLERLPCRLGLRCAVGDEYVALSLGPGGITEVVKASVLHGDWPYLGYWRPHGRSEPSCRPPVVGELGYPEFLSQSPPLSSALRVAIAITGA